MDFALNEEQRMFRAMFRDFAAKEIAPHADDIDHEEALPAEMVRKAANQGFMGATLPEAYFGAELDGVSYAMLIESLAGACASFAVLLATHVSEVAMSILEHGSDEQKETWLTPMAAGEVIGAFALTEPDAGSDAAALQTSAVVEGDEVSSADLGEGLPILPGKGRNLTGPIPQGHGQVVSAPPTPPKFPRPDDKNLIKFSPRFEVLDPRPLSHWHSR